MRTCVYSFQESGVSAYEQARQLRLLRNNYVLVAYGLLEEVPRETTPIKSKARKSQESDPDYVDSPAQKTSWRRSRRLPRTSPSAEPRPRKPKKRSRVEMLFTSSDDEDEDNSSNEKTPGRRSRRSPSGESTPPEPKKRSRSEMLFTSDEDNSSNEDSSNEKLKNSNNLVRWQRCRRPQLSEDVEKKLYTVIQGVSSKCKCPKGTMYTFACRIARTYHDLWSTDSEKLHCDREGLITKAIEEVFGQVPQEAQCPHDRNVARASKEMLPVLETLFEMPGGGMSIGTDDWVRSMIRKPQEIPIQCAAKYPRIEKALVEHLMKTGNKRTGFPERLESAYFFLKHAYVRLLSQVLYFFITSVLMLLMQVLTFQVRRFRVMKRFIGCTNREQ